MPDLGSDIFGYKRNPKPTGVFSTENSYLVFAGGDGGSEVDVGDDSKLGFLVQNWSVQYQQQVQELFEIGSNALFWAKGRPSGGGQLGRVIGKQDVDSPNSASFLPAAAYDICDGGATMILTAGGGACEPDSNVSGVERPESLDKAVEITMSGVVVTSIGFQMAVGDVRLMENFAWRFAYMALGTTTNPRVSS